MLYPARQKFLQILGAFRSVGFDSLTERLELGF